MISVFLFFLFNFITELILNKIVLTLLSNNEDQYEKDI